MLLYLLIYGEAANCRFLPEYLCFVFFCASNALTLEPTAVEDELDSARDYGSEKAQHYKYELRPAQASSMPLKQDDFLENIIGPVYTFLEPFNVYGVYYNVMQSPLVLM